MKHLVSLGNTNSANDFNRVPQISTSEYENTLQPFGSQVKDFNIISPVLSRLQNT